MLIDSHCHLDFPDFEGELDTIIARALDANVKRMVTICTKLAHFESVYAIAKNYVEVYCAVGVHPHQAGDEKIKSIEPLLECAQYDKVVGIGESGLDYFYNNASREDQIQSFRYHIEAAQETDLPLIVHAREADDDIIRLLQEGYSKRPYRCVIHCFSSGYALAEAAIEMGHYLSLSGIATFKKSEDLRSIIKKVPLNRLLLETDAPFLAPQPKRGRRNEPAYVAHIAQIMAQALGISEADFIKQTGKNFFRLFSKVSKPHEASI